LIGETGKDKIFVWQRRRPRRLHTEGDCEMQIETEKEQDGRWIAEVLDLPGVMVYSTTREGAIARAEALALRVIADRLDHGEDIPELNGLFAISA